MLKDLSLGFNLKAGSHFINIVVWKSPHLKFFNYLYYCNSEVRLAFPFKKSYLPVYLLIILTFFAAINSLFNKAGRPFLLKAVNGNLIVYSDKEGTVPEGASVILIDNIHFVNTEQLEVYLDGKSINDVIKANYIFRNEFHSLNIHLTRYYTLFDISSQIISSILFFLLGIFVTIKGPKELATRLFLYACFLTGIVIIATPSNFSNPTVLTGCLLRSIFHFCYAFVSVLFLHFTLVFPFERKSEISILIKSLYGLAAAFSLLLNYFFINAVFPFDAVKTGLFIDFYNIFRMYLTVILLSSIFNIIYSYFTCKNRFEKKKLKWILYGFIIGPGSYLVCWVVSQLVLSRGLLPEALVNLLLASVPLTTSIAIVKYHFLDIDLIINKSLVYFIVISLFIGAYILFLSTISFLFNLEEKLIIVASGTLIGLLFQPVKLRIQIIVDKKFFRVQYSFRTAIASILNKIKLCNSIEELSDRVIECFENIIPVDKMLLVSINSKTSSIKVVNRNSFNGKMRIVENFIKKITEKPFNSPYGSKDMVESDVNINFIPASFYKETGLYLIMPVLAGKNKLIGVIALGKKKSGKLYALEDIELIEQVAADCSFIMQRIYLQNELLKKTLEADNLEELNKLKSFFVSTVSHDLKSPLTAIRMYTDFLKDDISSPIKREEYLTVIEEETNNLLFLIDNVLDYSRIESGVKGYIKKEVCINELLNNILDSIKYQLRINNFTLSVKEFDEYIFISADKDALKEALMNLISNAIKFSLERKEIEISTILNDKYATINITDFGLGISKKEIDKLFTPFYRTKEVIKNNIQGTGLGLSIVKHVVDAHKGLINVSSSKAGTTFSITLPITRKETFESSFIA
jgi:signal transduction histidine kinase